METIHEIVTITTTAGKVQVFHVCRDPERYDGTRAYAQDSTLYYDRDVFERGLASGKAAKVERKVIGDIFDYYG